MTSPIWAKCEDPLMKKRPKGKAQKKARKGVAVRATRAPSPALERSLQYKVIELSTVDEGALERTFNEWVRKGWNLDGVQFAMRESSKRPSMAFVFFTREGEAVEHDAGEAEAKLRRMAEPEGPIAEVRSISPYQRLAELAGLDDDEPVDEGLTLEPETDP
jgi:hypothetical protein